MKNDGDLPAMIYKDKIYILMPYITHGECHGCVFEGEGVKCPHTDNLKFCDVNAPILIEDTPEAMAEYIARRLK